VVAVLKCPNCGAPLQGSSPAEQRACAYCGALLQVPKSAPPLYAPQSQPQPQSSRAILRLSVLATLSVVLAAGLAAFRGASSSSSESPVAAPGVASPPKPSGVAWNRLEGIDIHATVDQAKLALKQQFPEAHVDQDKDYGMDVDHPILSRALYSWSWGCTCLEGVVFFFKDYPTRMKTEQAFIPCLVRGLGPIAKSAPPFDYDWPAHGDVPRVHLGPQDLSVDIERGTSEESYRRVLRVLGGCRN
jgi:hypothetical protein